MTLGKMPLLVWLNLVVACMILIVISPLTAAQIMLLLDRFLGAHFFDTQAGGSAVLWQHFFWIFGHPEVYVLMLPGFAFTSEIIPVFSRKVIFGYPAMVAARWRSASSASACGRTTCSRWGWRRRATPSSRSRR
jgi:cytochrome c oxidase subunit 1